MPYRLPNPAMNVGSWARNHATAPRLALLTLWCSAAGRIGNSAAKSSSEESREAISRRNFSPFFGPTVAMKDCIVTLNNTASADGEGNSLTADGGSCNESTKLTHATAGPATMTGYGEPWGSEFTDRVIPPKHEKLGCASRLLRVSCRYGMRRFVTPYRCYLRSGYTASDRASRVGDAHG